MKSIASVRISTDCTACGNCLLTCGPGALLRAPKRPRVTSACTGCGLCIEVCPVDAITEIYASSLGPIPPSELTVSEPIDREPMDSDLLGSRSQEEQLRG